MTAWDNTNFDRFYSSILEPRLPQLREECKRADRWGIIAIIATVMGFGSFLAYHAGMLPGALAAWLFVLFAAMLVFAIYQYTNKNDRFTSDYKFAVIKAIMDEICPGLQYKPDDYLEAWEYKISSLYRHYFDYFDGNDLISGSINNIPFHCSELHTQFDDIGTKQITVFKGLFIVAGINKKFSGGTYVWPVDNIQLPNSRMDEYARLLPMPRVAAMHYGDPEFEAIFSVYSNWPSQANELLTPTMRSKMLELRKKLDTDVCFSFVAGQCYIALPLQADLLEPSAYDPGDKEEIRKYFLTIRVIPEIINQLPLQELQ